MKQYFRRPQDVVGEDRDLLTYWNTMSGKVQLRLLESGLSVSTLGELKMLQEQITRAEEGAAGCNPRPVSV